MAELQFDLQRPNQVWSGFFHLLENWLLLNSDSVPGTVITSTPLKLITLMQGFVTVSTLQNSFRELRDLPKILQTE